MQTHLVDTWCFLRQLPQPPDVPVGSYPEWHFLQKCLPWSDLLQHVLCWLYGGRQGLLPGKITAIYSVNVMLIDINILLFWRQLLTYLKHFCFAGWLWWPSGVQQPAAGYCVLGLRLCPEEQTWCLCQGLQLHHLDQKHHELQLSSHRFFEAIIMACFYIIWQTKIKI